ncbi:hypothetical protein SAZ_05465 [Streptomyces noursei ZPM]|uniref:Pirin n=1 Tax=Streptomyces noursei TaxID=1971 RepID=A0A401QUU0_STRNR|nr:hypothetical protein [Streptomyces noursei]AKA08495.1 hypothetical protein SAZ_05465 [Streptomyces noursei ZPM]EOT03538.1 hypothetical protein K530_13254 [Streptomyces noursei CCRC 11814]EXU92730.1 hypothetical protein P354_00205 [Streptomyces noursei PD-1]UWS70414.1 hypothetical protein N1H47_03740 [Streptomyces noursei]GCB89130.1 hypothetical protein SALB_01804 [Streptomyces noursei]
MKITHVDEDHWFKDHPSGSLHFQHLLKGEPGSPDNFMYVLAKQQADWSMPRHRHNFDQIRLPLVGENTTYGRGLVLKEGQIGYFPEGLSYGPQESPMNDMQPGEPLGLTLQFGGSSGYGFMSIEQRRQAIRELTATGGQFDGPFYIGPDGKRQWGLTTIWQHVFGESLKYPRPRYGSPIVADPKRFNWLPVKGAETGVEHKFLGAFSERRVWVELLRLPAGTTWSSTDSEARRITTVLVGNGECDREQISYLSTIQADAGEPLNLTAGPEPLELFLIGMPPIMLPETESDQYDLEEFPEEDREPSGQQADRGQAPT